MNGIVKNIRESHFENYEKDPLIVRSPGRINIIGEHTDYNSGYVLPAAVDRYIYVGISLRSDKKISLHSLNFDEHALCSVDHLEKQPLQWVNYIIGVVAELGLELPTGFNLTVFGDVPMGAGMSSSAAFESAVAFAIYRLFDLDLSRMELARIGQRCEHNYIGVKCGIMDQFASLFGKDNQVIRLDCRDLTYNYFPLKLGDYVLLLLNTNVSHSLASSAYNKRRSSCEEAVERIKNVYPGVESLRDVSIEMLDKVISDKDEECYIRAQYVIEEIQRVTDVCEYLAQGRLEEVGQKMFETHEGLSWLYEVSCPELDFLVEYVRNFSGNVLGGRMMGGGFGGCTINIVRECFVDELIEEVSQAYEEKFGIALGSYRVKLGMGTEIIG